MTTPSRCSEDLLEAMRAGNVSLADTARAAQEPPDVQRKALEDVLSGRAPTLTTALTPETPPTAERLTLELTAEDVAHLETVLAHYQTGKPTNEISRAEGARIAIRELSHRIRGLGTETRKEAE